MFTFQNKAQFMFNKRVPIQVFNNRTTVLNKYVPTQDLTTTFSSQKANIKSNTEVTHDRK